MKISVLGDGAWGTALAMVLVSNGHDVTIWGAFPDYLAQMEKERVNSRFLKGVRLPDELNFTADMAKAAEADFLLTATPTQYLRGVLETLKPYYNPERHSIINVAKGIENGTLLTIDRMCNEILGKCRYCALCGPSHAEEVSRQVPTAVVAASDDAVLAESVRNLFINDTFRVYTSDDPVGVELGGALKNVIAIAAGIIDGMALGDNPKAALLTRGIAEMSRLGAALGGKPTTFAGLSGVGDLIVTCTSGHSRNRYVGEQIGKGRKLPDIQAEMGMVCAEGTKTAISARALALKCGVDAPLVDAVYATLYEDKPPAEAVRELMTRKAKSEDDFSA
jgi:glycerol-3-phosphate dehydrogenase (NAD(P)+)